MRIGELASLAGVNVQTLRYYERRGLLGATRRATSGFRMYDADAARQVLFIRRAQNLGFTLEEIRDLLALWQDSAQSCSAVERRASATLARIEDKITALRQMSNALARYVSACRNRTALQHCPLLEELGDANATVMSSRVVIELVYDRDCPNVDRARAMIRTALSEVGVEATWTEWDRDGADTPPNLRHHCSPTVLVNGRDIGCDENAPAVSDANLCRICLDECGCICGAPSSKLIVGAIRGVKAA